MTESHEDSAAYQWISGNSFPGHEAHSVEWAGLKGKKNGELLQAAEGGGYQVLLTVDQGILASRRWRAEDSRSF